MLMVYSQNLRNMEIYIYEIRWYGTGGKLGFPMGNGVGAVYWKKNFFGDMKTSYYEHLDTEYDIKTKTPGLDIFF